MKMQVSIAKIKPNPFRDFGLYPLDPDHVERLRASIHELGFFSGITARPSPDGTGYELAAGHHRLEAAKQEGLREVEAIVRDYDDTDMVAIMIKENLTQRGYNAGSVLDSVAAQCKLTAYAVLVSEKFDQNDGHVSKILLTSGIFNQKSLDTAKAIVADKGPGYSIIYRAMNGFDLSERRSKKDVETIKETEIKEALASLRSSGEMAKLMARVHEQVETVRAVAEAEAKREAEAKAKAEAEAVAKAKAEAEVAAKHEAEAKRKADAARKAAERANTEAKAEAEAAAAKAKAEADDLARRRKEAAAAAKERAQKAQKEREAAETEAATRAGKRAAEAKAIAAQAELEAVYDIRCMNVFRLTSHEKAFREGMVSENGRRFIPKEKQLQLAQQIRKEIDATEKKRGMDLGSTTVKGYVDALLRTAMGLQKEIDEAERISLLMDQDRMRIEARWETVRRGLQQAESALATLVEEEKKWDYTDAPFPVDHEILMKFRGLSATVEKLSKHMVGYDF